MTKLLDRPAVREERAKAIRRPAPPRLFEPAPRREVDWVSLALALVVILVAVASVFALVTVGDYEAVITTNRPGYPAGEIYLPEPVPGPIIPGVYVPPTLTAPWIPFFAFELVPGS